MQCNIRFGLADQSFAYATVACQLIGQLYLRSMRYLVEIYRGLIYYLRCYSALKISRLSYKTW
jgi:hypothetical protein